MPTSIYKSDDGLKVMLVTKDHNIDEVLDAMENALRGAGYHVRLGSLDFKEEDEMGG